MTEAQRDYLADLAARKGIRVRGTDSMSVAVASAKITELEAMPDAEFREIAPEEEAYIQKVVDKAREELGQWGFLRQA